VRDVLHGVLIAESGPRRIDMDQVMARPAAHLFCPTYPLAFALKGRSLS
jgi:hypothetical protein